MRKLSQSFKSCNFDHTDNDHGRIAANALGFVDLLTKNWYKIIFDAHKSKFSRMRLHGMYHIQM